MTYTKAKRAIKRQVRKNAVKGNYKVKKTMEEFKAGTLRSGSKHGPKVTKRSQAIAIGLSEQKKANRGGY